MSSEAPFHTKWVRMPILSLQLVGGEENTRSEEAKYRGAKTAADIADRLYKRMQRLSGVEIELPDDGIDESAADAGEEK